MTMGEMPKKRRIVHIARPGDKIGPAKPKEVEKKPVEKTEKPKTVVKKKKVAEPSKE